MSLPHSTASTDSGAKLVYGFDLDDLHSRLRPDGDTDWASNWAGPAEGARPVLDGTAAEHIELVVYGHDYHLDWILAAATITTGPGRIRAVTDLATPPGAREALTAAAALLALDLSGREPAWHLCGFDGT